MIDEEKAVNKKKYKRFLEGGFLFFFPSPYNGKNMETKIDIEEIKTGFAQGVSDKLMKKEV
nr:hypothetical protein BSM_34490 [uncultured archaeon]